MVCFHRKLLDYIEDHRGLDAKPSEKKNTALNNIKSIPDFQTNLLGIYV